METSTPGPNPKKKRLSFDSTKCCFCNKLFNKNKTDLHPDKCDSFMSICRERSDELSTSIIALESKIRSGEVCLCYHKACRAKYVHPFYNKVNEKGFATDSANPNIDGTFTRSKLKVFDFDWKQNCFVCGQKCNSKHRSKWSTVEGSVNENSILYSKLLQAAKVIGDEELYARLLATNGDLVAVEARYHRKKGCLARYLSDKRNNTFENQQDKGKLFKACAVLKEELKANVESNKTVYEMSYLKARIIEICESSGDSIGSSKVKAKYIKKCLSQIWPDIIFISRQGLTDLMCSKNHTLGEALTKSVDLEKSITELNEQDNCSTALFDCFTDHENDEISVIHQAAKILRNRLLKTEGLKGEYYSPQELSIEHQKRFLDPMLLKFMVWLCKSNGTIEDIDKKTIAVCSDITTLVKPVITPKHLGLTIYLHHSFGSKKLIEDLNSHGYTLPYTEVRHFLTSTALHVSANQQQTPSGGIIPSDLTACSNETQEPRGLLIAAADNWDHNEHTLSGKKSTHAMTSILVSTSSSQPQTAVRIPRVQNRSVDTSLLPGSGMSHTLSYSKPTTRPSPLLQPPVKLEELSCPESQSVKLFRLKEIMYHMSRQTLASLCDDRAETVPPWTVFQSYVQQDSFNETAEIVYNPIIMSTPNDYNTVYTVLKRTKEQMNTLGQSVCPIVFDMGLLTKALEIVWARPTEFEGVFPLEGGMHFMMSVFAGIGHLYGDAGLKDLMVDSDVFARLTAEHILSGRDFDRALRSMLIIDEVLSRRFFFQLQKWADANSKSLPTLILEKFKALDITSEIEQEAVLGMVEEIDNSLLHIIDEFHSVGRSTSPLFRFWDDYLQEVSLPLRMYLASSRHGLWDAHKFSKAKLLPFLFAANRTEYSRFMPYLVLQMNRLPNELVHAFEKGSFVTKLTKGSFNGVWFYYVLQVTENKALKSSGGIIGITHTDSALVRWFLSRPLTAKYASSYSCSSESGPNSLYNKHHTDSPFHKNAYNEAVQKMLKMFDENFVDPFSISSPPIKLLNFATGIEISQEVESSLLSCHDQGKKMLYDFVQERLIPFENNKPSKEFFDPLPRAKLKTIKSSNRTVDVKSKVVSFNGKEMYLRLLAINAYKKVPLERVLSFENAPVPLSLFTDTGDMMSTKKSDFGEKLENLVNPDFVLQSISDPECVVYDAMAVIQMLQPSNDQKLTYKQMAAGFWNYILKSSVQSTQVHVVFDQYFTNSLKFQTRQKRGKSNSTAPVAMQMNMLIQDWKRVLASSKSKRELTKLYTIYLTENCQDLLDREKIVFVSGGMGEKSLCICCNAVSFVDEVESSQEEADGRIILHLAYAASLGIKKAVVVSPDTDVLVLLIHYYNIIGIDTLFLKTGRKSIHTDRTRYIPIHMIVANLLPAQLKILLSIYCLTGCDTCSSMYGIGKKKAFQILLKYAEKLGEISDLGCEPCLSSVSRSAATSFVGYLYGSANCDSLNSLRKSIVLEKKRVKPRKLPPTDDSFMLHLLRCTYQLIIWRNATKAKLSPPNPLYYGYVVDEDTGRFAPKMMSQPAAAPELLSDLVCLCSDLCCGECICTRNEQPCTQASVCKGCIENIDTCQNLFTMLAFAGIEDY